MTKIFKHYSDPGHGWVAMKRKLIESLGLMNKITHFSYWKGDTVYLEEDLDAPTVLDALTKSGIQWKTVTISHDRKSPIRFYERV